MTKNIRQIRVEDKVAYIPLTQGYEAIIDAEDVPLVENYNWCLFTGGRKGYTLYATAKINSKDMILLHRGVMKCNKDDLIDHINGNGLDNRKANLRIATASQNQWNKGKSKNNKSGYKGVCLQKDCKKWRAAITVTETGKSFKKYLGLFNTPEEAYAAYCKAAQELHGEYIHPTVASSVLHKD